MSVVVLPDNLDLEFNVDPPSVAVRWFCEDAEAARKLFQELNRQRMEGEVTITIRNIRVRDTIGHA